MRKNILSFIFVLIIVDCNAQDIGSRYIGINILQLPSTTLNFNVSRDVRPKLTSMIDVGYTFNYVDSYDYVGYFLTPHLDLWDGYKLSVQSGGYLKLGALRNFRKSFATDNFFNVGLFLTNALVYEEATKSNNQLNHLLYIPALSASIGYEFKITDRIKTSISYQISISGPNQRKLYSYENTVPGLGHTGTGRNFFPLLILNLKYKH